MKDDANRYIHAIEQMVEQEGMFVSQSSMSADLRTISVSVYFETGEVRCYTEGCSFQTGLVMEWVDNGELEGKQHVAAKIAGAAKRLHKHHSGH